MELVAIHSCMVLLGSLVLSVLVEEARASPVVSHHLSAAAHPNHSQGRHQMVRDRTQGDHDCWLFAYGGYCDFYTCMEKQLSCDRSKVLVRSVGHKFCYRLRQQGHTLNQQGQEWGQQVNNCILRRLSDEMVDLSSGQCMDAGKRIKTVFHECAAAEDICEVLWPNRRQLLQIFTSKSWLTLVEAARFCPRDTVTRFIFWSLNELQFYPS